MNPITNAVTQMLISGPGLTHLDHRLTLVYVIFRGQHALSLSRYFANVTDDEIAQAVAAITEHAHIAPDQVQRFPDHVGPLRMTRLEWNT